MWFAYYDCVILLKILQGKQVLVCNGFLLIIIFFFFCYLTLLLEIYLNGFSLFVLFVLVFPVSTAFFI